LAAGLFLTSGSALAAVGDITEYPVPTASGLVRITMGPDGNVWFTESVANRVAKITTSGAVTEYALPTAGRLPGDIAVGPDGNLWFTESGSGTGGYIASVTTSGLFTEYPIPMANSPSGGLAVGADGNLWFASQVSGAGKVASGGLSKVASSGASVVKVTTSGIFTMFPVPTDGIPNDFVAGPDGNLWFTEANVDRVGNVTTSGNFSPEHQLPNLGNSSLWQIASGPDGNLWFTDYFANKVAKMTTAGVFTEYSIPTANSNPTGIAGGPDGNVWFTEYNGNKVARVTPSGVFTEYVPPTASSGPYAIAMGPDRKMWFTEYTANNVAKIVAQPSTATTNVNSVSLTGGPVTFSATFLDANNAPIVGALVNYSQQSGPPGCTATFIPTSGTTDATGSVSTTAVIPPNCPGVFVLAANKPDPITVTATITEEGSIVVPEAPTAILLPIMGIAAVGVVLMWKRRRGDLAWR
jgi:streptogramin lyase